MVSKAWWMFEITLIALIVAIEVVNLVHHW
jgi:hypothetical protein